MAQFVFYFVVTPHFTGKLKLNGKLSWRC